MGRLSDFICKLNGREAVNIITVFRSNWSNGSELQRFLGLALS